jgi:SAM-dependent methyltransferase
MSSPIALERRAASRQALVNLHQNLSHGRRVRTLAAALANHIRTLTGDTETRCLDVGCGDMTIAEAVHALALNTDWRCIDVHPLPERLADDARWRKYRPFDGRTIPYADSEFDVAVICDVLHHTPDNAASLLREAARVARYVLLKDHFEYGPYSRSMLRLMDFVGQLGLRHQRAGALLHEKRARWPRCVAAVDDRPARRGARALFASARRALRASPIVAVHCRVAARVNRRTGALRS